MEEVIMAMLKCSGGEQKLQPNADTKTRTQRREDRKAQGQAEADAPVAAGEATDQAADEGGLCQQRGGGGAFYLFL